MNAITEAPKDYNPLDPLFVTDATLRRIQAIIKEATGTDVKPPPDPARLDLHETDWVAVDIKQLLDAAAASLDQWIV